MALCSDDHFSIKGTIDYLNYNMKNDGLYIVYHTMKLYNTSRFNKLSSNSMLKWLNNPKDYRDIDYESTSDVMFMLAFIASEIDEKISCEKREPSGKSGAVSLQGDRTGISVHRTGGADSQVK